MKRYYSFILLICSILLALPLLYGEGTGDNPKKVAAGQKITIDASDMEKVEKFETTPSVNMQSPVLKNAVKLKVYSPVREPVEKIQAVLKSKVKVLSNNAINSLYKNGKSVADADLNKSAPLHIKVSKVSRNDKNEYDSGGYYSLEPPAILSLKKGNGAYYDTPPKPGENVVIEGLYFGVKAPKVWIEYPVPGKNKIKPLRCKIIKPYPYSDAFGKTGKSCMNPDTGESKITVRLPKKWPKKQTPSDSVLVLFNSVGAAYANMPFEPEFFNLVVNNGNGSGIYRKDDTVTISASLPDDQVFTRWSGDTAYITDPLSAVTTVTMPAQNITVTAEFSAAPPNSFSVSGTVSGEVAGGVKVSVDSQHAAVSSSDGTYVINGLQPGSYTVRAELVGYSFTPAEHTVTLTDTDVAGIDFTSSLDGYTLSVVNGTGSGSYRSGETVTISASLPDGQVFTRWSGDTAYIADPLSAVTTVTMPARNITVTAEFSAAPPNSFSVSGTVSGEVAEGVKVSVDSQHAAVTGSDGTYAINGLQPGSYTVRAELDGYSFTPAEQAVTLTDTDVTGIDFTSSLDGYILTVVNGAGSGSYRLGEIVTISASVPDGQVFTSWSGDTAYIVDPLSAVTTVTMPAQNITVTAEFSAAPPNTFSVSGTVSGEVAEGVKVSVDSQHAAVTGSDGTYVINGLQPGSYTVRPELDGYSFTPAEQAVTLTDTDVTGIDFTSTAVRYTLTVVNGTGSGSYRSGETVTISASVPDGQVFTSWSGDTAYIADSHNAVTTVTMPAQNITVTAEFSAAPPNTFSVSGTVSGEVAEGVKVSVDSQHAAVTGSDGTYVINGLQPGSYTVRAELDGYSFTPAEQAVTLTDTDVTGIDFTSTAVRYTLTVVNGTGSGSYRSGETVSVSASVPDGQVFTSWSGDTTYIADSHNAVTTVTMPAQNITVTAEFSAAPPNTFSVSGTVSGEVAEGVKVSVDSQHAAVTGSDGTYVINGLQPGSYTVRAELDGYSFTPSEQAVTLTDTDVTGIDFTSTAVRYTLTVVNGTGSGSYRSGETVTISASVPDGKEFLCWYADGEYLDNKKLSDAVLTMPEKDITVIAAFKGEADKEYAVIGKITGAVKAGVTVSVDASHNAVTASDGTYIITGLQEGTYSVTPELAGYIFLPDTRYFLISGSDVVNMDFNAVNDSVQLYHLCVINGNGTGDYPEGASVSVSADVTEEMKFSVWKGDTDVLSDENLSEQTITMPDHNAVIEAVLAPNTDNLVSAENAEAVFSFVPEGEIKNNNGSFELGIGAGTYYPGYKPIVSSYSDKGIDAWKNPPPKPYVDTTEKHSGNQSLCFEVNNTNHHPLLFIAPPNLLDMPSSDSEHHFSFWIKASKNISTITASKSATHGMSIRGSAGTEWKKVSGNFISGNKGVSVRIDMYSNEDEPFKVWIDDIVWSFYNPVDYTMPVADIAMDPVTDTGVLYPDSLPQFVWHAQGTFDGEAVVELYVKDVTRNGRTFKLYEGPLNLSQEPVSGSYKFKHPLPRGHYFSAVILKNPATGQIMAKAKQRFSVLTDLFKYPNPASFMTGGMYVFADPYGYTSHGVYSYKEQMRINHLCGCTVIRDLHTWQKLEPQYHNRAWDYFDVQYGFAHKFGNGFQGEVSGEPLKIGPWNISRIYNNGPTKPMDWIVTEGYLQGTRHQLLDGQNMTEDEILAYNGQETFWYAKKEDEESFVREFLSRYKNNGLVALEFKNEVNGMVPADYNVDNYMRPMYGIMKEVAPDIPAILCNMGAAKTRYIDSTITAGGLPYMDGFAFHAYPWPCIEYGSLTNIRTYRDYLDQNVADPNFKFAETELIFMYDPYELIRRLLVDISGGAFLSCGIPWRGYYATNTTTLVTHHNTGSLIPSHFAVMANALNYILAGDSHLTGSVRSFDNLLIAFFEKNLPRNNKEYIVVITPGNYDGKVPVFNNISLDGIEYQAYDETGQKISLPDMNPFVMTNNVLYITSRNPNLVAAFQNPDFEYLQSPQYRRIIFKNDSGFHKASIMNEGGKAYETACVCRNYSIGETDKIDSVMNGNIISTEDKIIPDALDVIALTAPQTNGNYLYISTDFYSDNTAPLELKLSSIGLDEVSVFLNGVKTADKLQIPEQFLLKDWISSSMTPRKGKNTLELFIKTDPDAASQHSVCIKVALPDAEQMCRTDHYSYSKELTVSPGTFLELENLTIRNQPPNLYRVIDKDTRSIVSFKSTANSPDHSVIFSFADGKAYAVTKYSIMPTRRFSKDWDFEGSNDKVNWTTLESITDHNFTLRETYTGTVANPAPYKYYRINFKVLSRGLEYAELNLYIDSNTWAP